ncbi:DUF421 domain-containing protein [Paenibacillus cremeus]|uniref:DUF421 domain-containing protein n=1 Tax=Paenibacillus cremeus TaxID=2163881 RepID=A0A559KIJ0_9BACL|nr:YetF domain-containing protein [Paenibacillus cremeus]TVY11936.1 DUF421 domain-containing protein [Paenibacillus cremeus]
MDMLTLFLRTLVVFMIVFLTMRVMGKRELGNLSVFDLVMCIMIAETASVAMQDLNTPILYGLVPMMTLIVIQLVLTFHSLKTTSAKRWLDSKSSTLLDSSRLFKTADVEFAMLEPLIKTAKKEMQTNQARPREGQAAFRYEGLPLTLIMDGKVQDENLAKLGKTRFWLKRELQTKGVKAFKEVFFCSVDHREKWFIDKKR